jgi:hypothetical protein
VKNLFGIDETVRCLREFGAPFVPGSGEGISRPWSGGIGNRDGQLECRTACKNLDPSHLFWMDADPLAAIVALGKAVHYVHAKDTSMNKAAQNLTGRLDTIEHRNVKDRSWSYVTLGYGHGELWWREFCYALRLNGYDG